MQASFERMSRKVMPFLVLMLDYMCWRGEESAIGRIYSFFEILVVMVVRGLFVEQSVALLPNIDGITECMHHFNLQNSHDIQVLSKEDCLLYQITNQCSESGNVGGDSAQCHNDSHLMRFGAIEGSEFLAIRLKPNSSVGKRRTKSAAPSSSSSSSASSIDMWGQHVERESTISASCSSSSCSSASSSMGASALSFGDSRSVVFGDESDVEADNDAELALDLLDMSMTSISSLDLSLF